MLIQKRLLIKLQTDLAIVMNPHVEDPNVLWETLRGLSDSSGPENSSYITDPNATLDKGSFELGKLLMADNSRIIIK